MTGPVAPETSVPACLYDLDAELAAAEKARERQLEALGETAGDVVATAHREAVTRILREVQRARRRLLEGLHGVCARCRGSIAAQRMRDLPWATECADCARSRYR